MEARLFDVSPLSMSAYSRSARKNSNCSCWVMLVVVASVFASGSAQTFLAALMVASDPALSDSFGHSVAVSGSLVVVGANVKTVGSNSYQGAAYVFSCATASSCTQGSELRASNGAQGDEFGYAVGISGNLVAIGAPYRNNNKGAVYLFACLSASSCIYGSQIAASNTVSGDYFGFSVAISGSLVVVGAYQKDMKSNSSEGAAYMFSCPTASSCTQASELTASNGAPVDYFGYAVAISESGTVVVVGAPYKTLGGYAEQGAAYVFSCQNVSACAQGSYLTDSNGFAGDEFGISVAISGSLVVAGASGKSIGSNMNQGAVFVFSCPTASSCTVGSEVKLANGAEYDNFGFSVAVSDSVVVVGAYLRPVGSNQGQGAAYIFSCIPVSSCTQGQELTVSNGMDQAEFGFSVAISGSLMVAGAPGYNSAAGAACAFSAMATTATSSATATSVSTSSRTAIATSTATATSAATATSTATPSAFPIVQFFYKNPSLYSATGPSAHSTLRTQLVIYDTSTRRRFPTVIFNDTMTYCNDVPNLFGSLVPLLGSSQLGVQVVTYNLTSSNQTLIDSDGSNCASPNASFYTGFNFLSQTFLLDSSAGCGGSLSVVTNAFGIQCIPLPTGATAPPATPTTPASIPTESSTPSPTTTTSTADTSPVGAIVGGVIGGLLFVALTALMLLWWRRRQTRKPDPMADSHAALTHHLNNPLDKVGYSNAMIVELAVQPSRTSMTKPAEPANTFSSADVDQAAAALLQKDYRRWSRDDVCLWLATLNVKPATIGVMAANNVSGDILEEYESEDTLIKLGVTIGGDRIKISKAIQQVTMSRTARRSSSNASLPENKVVIGRKDIVIADVLASGNFGKVFRGTFKGDSRYQTTCRNEFMTRRRVSDHRIQIADDATREDFLEEAKLMKSIPAHPNVVSYFGVCVMPNELYLVMEFCDLGSLQAFVQANEVPVTTMVNIATQIAAGMSHLSSFIVHRDLATRNILVSTAGSGTRVTARIADFGLSRPLVNNGYMRLTGRHPIPVPWTATEVLQGAAHTPAADVWSFGVVLWEMFEGCPNEPPMPNRTQFPPLSQPAGCPDPVFALMKRCWALNPNERPTFEVIFADVTTIAQQIV